MRDLEAPEVEAWTDEAEQSATGLFRILGSSNGHADRVSLPVIGPELLRRSYRAMLTARALDEAAGALVKGERIGSYVGSWGTEAAVVGAVAALAPDDVVAPGRRHSGAALFRGLPTAAAVAQLLGNAHDLARGRQLPGVLSSPRALHVLPAVSGAGRQLPVAAGVAWAAKMQHRSTVALAYLDATETDAEDFHAGLNFAGVFRTPAIFVCVGARAPVSAGLSQTIALKALGYGIFGVRVDGDDFLAVHSAVRTAAERARRGEGATLVEAVPGGDPLERLRPWLAAAGVLGDAEEAALRSEVEREVSAAVAAELDVGAPPVSSMAENVLAAPGGD